MNTIVENLSILESIKHDIGNAITQKGGVVSDEFGGYAQAIKNLPSGGDNRALIGLIQKDIMELVIPEGTTFIGDYSFHELTSLTELTIPSSVTDIYSNAFYNCYSLSRLIYANGCEKVFYIYGIDSVTMVTIPHSVTSIEGSAFYEYMNLSDIFYDGTYAEWLSFAPESFIQGFDVTVHCTDGDFPAVEI